jgi:hypothetical protein
MRRKQNHNAERSNRQNKADDNSERFEPSMIALFAPDNKKNSRSEQCNHGTKN